MLTLLQRFIDTEYEWDSRPSSATEIREIGRLITLLVGYKEVLNHE